MALRRTFQHRNPADDPSARLLAQWQRHGHPCLVRDPRTASARAEIVTYAARARVCASR